MDGFTEDELKKLLEAINFVTANLEFQQGSGNFTNALKWYQHMNFLQKQLYPKVEKHILEVRAYVPPKKPTRKKAT